jgi:hypothetical protein
MICIGCLIWPTKVDNSRVAPPKPIVLKSFADCEALFLLEGHTLADGFFHVPGSLRSNEICNDRIDLRPDGLGVDGFISRKDFAGIQVENS